MIKAEVTKETTELEMSGNVYEILTNLTFLINKSLLQLSRATGIPDDILRDHLREGVKLHKNMEEAKDGKN